MDKHVNTRREEHACTLIFCVHIHVHPLERMQSHTLTDALTHTRARAGTHSRGAYAHIRMRVWATGHAQLLPRFTDQNRHWLQRHCRALRSDVI